MTFLQDKRRSHNRDANNIPTYISAYKTGIYRLLYETLWHTLRMQGKLGPSQGQHQVKLFINLSGS